MGAGAAAWWRDAKECLAAATTAKRAGHGRAAYNEAGQSIEFALKAILMVRRGWKEWPPENRNACWHDLKLIAENAGLGPEIADLRRNHPARYANWLTVRDWDSNARFPGNAPKAREITDLYLAIVHDRDGIMPWLESIYLSA
jgi:hypothetical protein